MEDMASESLKNFIRIPEADKNGKEFEKNPCNPASRIKTPMDKRYKWMDGWEKWDRRW